ncbi:unnamed protein product [Peronospora belbahrii]|uniref:Uncharacterized protein n=1 Tax=Peronospora belbahrii TaxID=622444 RepID=A0ABN8CN30_9STRA|nr:unnamed protein product [Peronospora belbahrii]
MSRDINRTPVLRDEELAALLRLTPVGMRDEVQNQPFTVEEARECIMTPQSVENARAQLEESLASTRDLMNELGRSGPWRTHVEHFNKNLLHHRSRGASEEEKEKASVENTDSQPHSEPIADSSGGDAASSATDWIGVFDP